MMQMFCITVITMTMVRGPYYKGSIKIIIINVIMMISIVIIIIIKIIIRDMINANPADPLSPECNTVKCQEGGL